MSSARVEMENSELSVVKLSCDGDLNMRQDTARIGVDVVIAAFGALPALVGMLFVADEAGADSCGLLGMMMNAWWFDSLRMCVDVSALIRTVR